MTSCTIFDASTHWSNKATVRPSQISMACKMALLIMIGCNLQQIYNPIICDFGLYFVIRGPKIFYIYLYVDLGLGGHSRIKLFKEIYNLPINVPHGFSLDLGTPCKRWPRSLAII